MNSGKRGVIEMKNARISWIVGLLLLCSAALVLAPDAPTDKVNVPLSDPSRPVMPKIGLISGSQEEIQFTNFNGDIYIRKGK
jgi:hypothetical protein